MAKTIKHIGIIGTGNLGTQLAMQADELNYEVQFVYNRTTEKAQALAGLVDAKAITHLSNLVPCDVILLTVPDHQIPSIVQELLPYQSKLQNTIIVHCSGSTPVDVLSPFTLYGVFYPLQTFTKNKKVDWHHLPIFVEGCDIKTTKTLEVFAGSFSNSVYVRTSEERKKIHCGAVLVSNFVHALAHAALHISQEKNFQRIYFPLINEAIQKLQEYPPEECITGPAKRQDVQTIKSHLDIIQNPDIQQVYKLLTQYIQHNM